VGEVEVRVPTAADSDNAWKSSATPALRDANGGTDGSLPACYAGDRFGGLITAREWEWGATAAVDDGAVKDCVVTQRPLYGLLVIGELPHEPDPHTPKRPQAAPAESFLKKALARWMRRLHPTRERSG